MKKLLILNSSVSGGGAGKALIEYIKALDLKKIEVHVLIPFDGRVGDDLARAGAHIHYLKLLPERFGKTYLRIPKILRRRWIESMINVASMPFFIFKVGRLVRELDIDLIFGNHQILTPIVVGAGRLTGRPVVIYSREVTEGFWPQLYFRWIAKSSVLKKVFSVSQVSAHLYDFTGKTEIVYDCLDIEEVRQSAKPNLRKQFGLSEGDIIIGYLGRIIARKGVPLLIEAFGRISTEIPNAKLVVVGGNDPGLHYDLLGQYKDQVKHLGLSERIIFTDFYPQPIHYLSDFDVSVLPSLNPEPFGMVVMEAMCLGVPVVVPDNSGVAEVIRDGIDGLQFKAMNAESLATVLKRMVLDRALQREIGVNGKRRAEELFDPRKRKDEISETILDIFPEEKSEERIRAAST